MPKHLLIGFYQRHIASNHERMFENVFDWEHLPHLHSSTFSDIELTDKTKKTLYFTTSLWPKILGLKQKIRLQGCRSKRTWVVRVLSGFMQGLVTYSTVSRESKDGFYVNVKFLAPKGKWHYAPLGLLLSLSFRRLYKEDVAMMIARQRNLDALANLGKPPVSKQEAVVIGKACDIKLPYRFTFNTKPYILNKNGEDWIAYTAYCPHLLRSFRDIKINNGKILCPWHGYEFDLQTRLSNHANCRLPKAPRIIQVGQHLKAVLQ